MVVGKNFGKLVTLKIWWGKLWRIAMNYPCLLHLKFAHATRMPRKNLKTTIVYFIIVCGVKWCARLQCKEW